MTHRKPTTAAVYGIDLGKNVFHVAGADADGAIVGNWKLRETLYCSSSELRRRR